MAVKLPAETHLILGKYSRHTLNEEGMIDLQSD